MTIAAYIQKHLPNLDIRIIFDVGANKGQSALAYVEEYPSAQIYAFEPVKSTFEILNNAVRHSPHIKTFNIAFGQTSGTGRMSNVPGATNNRIVSDQNQGDTELIQIMTGKEFCRLNDVPHIDFLKIDTEGFDLQVLEGFEDMLKNQSIHLLQIECGMNDFNRKHIPLEKFKTYLSPLGYCLFRITEQALDTRFSGLPFLRRSNALFLSMKTANANRQKKK